MGSHANYHFFIFVKIYVTLEKEKEKTTTEKQLLYLDCVQNQILKRCFDIILSLLL